MSARIERVARAMRAGDDDRGMMRADERWYDRARVGLLAASRWHHSIDRLGRFVERRVRASVSTENPEGAQ